MDHPNAIYFQLFSYAVMVLVGALLFIGSFNKGPNESTDVVPNWLKRLAGISCLVLGMLMLIGHLVEFLSA